MSIGQRLSDALKAKKMSQNTLGEHMGVTRQTVNKWVKDQSDMPVKSLIKLCDILDISADWLLRGEGQLSPTKSMADTKDMQIFFLEQSLKKAESRIEALNREIGGLKKPNKDNSRDMGPSKHKGNYKYHKL
jgi:transcriptional regulator with XRE-family HTH domain